MTPAGPAEIRSELQTFLYARRLRNVYFAPVGGAPPQLAYITPFARLSLILAGRHPMLIADRFRALRILPQQDDAVFIPSNHWNKPDWSEPGAVMTFLFGHRQIGISLTRHDGQSVEPAAIAKTSLLHPFDAVTANLIAALFALPNTSAAQNLSPRVVESILHAFLRHFDRPHVRQANKAQRTYESICLYLQENAHTPLTRESIADRFNLTPSHVSRLFRSEGAMRFSDYLNLVRINRAKVLLTDGRAAVKEIAADCGYLDPAYFCRVFRRFTKTTPTTYRLMQMSNIDRSGLR